MNAVAKVNDDATKVDLESPMAAPAPKPAAVTPQPDAVAPKKSGARGGRRLLLMISVPLALAAGGGYFWLTGGRYEETENANLQQAKVSIASEAEGRIVEIDFADNAPVHKGDVLFVVDPEPYRIALAQADAALAAARMQVEQLRAELQPVSRPGTGCRRRAGLCPGAIRAQQGSCKEGHQRRLFAR